MGISMDFGLIDMGICVGILMILNGIILTTKENTMGHRGSPGIGMVAGTTGGKTGSGIVTRSDMSIVGASRVG